MGDLLRAEWIKVRSLRSSFILGLVAVALTVVVAVLVGSLRHDVETEDLAAGYLGGFLAATFLFAVIATLVAASEFRTGTIRATLTATPRRGSVAAAKIVMVGFSALVTGALMEALALGLGLGISRARGQSVELSRSDWRLAAGGLIFLVLLSLLGLALGFLIRNPAGALVTLIVWPLLIENLISGVFYLVKTERFVKYLPYRAGFALYADNAGSESFSRWLGGVYFASWVAGLLILGIILFRRRDA